MKFVLRRNTPDKKKDKSKCASNLLHGIDIKRLFRLFVLTLLLVGYLIPLVFNLAEFIHLQGIKDVLALLLPQGRRLSMLANSFLLAGCLALSAGLIGIPAAAWLWKLNRTRYRFLRWFVLLLVPLPPYIHALCWSQACNRLNTFLHMSRLGQLSCSGFVMSWWVQLMAFLPLFTALALIGFETIDKELIDAGRLLRNDLFVLHKVILPLAAPILLGAGGLLVILSVTDYSVPSIFQFNVYALEIFSEYSASGDPAQAFLLSLPLLIILSFVLLLIKPGLKKVALSRDNNNTFIAKLPFWYKCLESLALIILGLQIIVPLTTLILKSSAWHNLSSAFTSSFSEIKLTFVISLLTAVIALVPAYLGAIELNKKDKLSKFGQLIILLPLILPAPLIGVGLIGLRDTLFAPFSHEILMPVLGALSRFAPFAILIMSAQLQRINSAFLEAASIIQKNSLQTLFVIKLPLLAPGFFIVFALTFMLTAGELGATLMLAAPGYSTLTLKIYNYMHYGATETVASLCLIMIIMILSSGTAALVTFKLSRRWLV